jgi:hypothetical protein
MQAWGSWKAADSGLRMFDRNDAPQSAKGSNSTPGAGLLDAARP